MGFFKKVTRFVKKVVSAPVKIVKAVVDPAIDLVTDTFKAVTSPFTGGFDLPDTAVNFDTTSATIKAATVVDFNTANKAVPVLYGNRIETATIPVFVGTWGDNSADTSRQYLYMAAVISQGFHGSNNDKDVDGVMGSLLSRMLIDGKPVHLGGLSNTMNDNYSSGYDGSTSLNKTNNGGGIFASGKGGVQPAQHTITKGTFANRLKIQYFDGSADQPVSSLLDEHPEWSPTGQAKLSGMHYVALRFLLQAADVTVGAGDGGGTFKNPYGSAPAVVVTTSGRSIPNIIASKDVDPGYEEKFQTSYEEKEITSYLFYRQTLTRPAGDGDLNTFDEDEPDAGAAAATATVPCDSDTVFEVQRFRDFQPRKYSTTGNPQTLNIHDLLYDLGWTYDYVYVHFGSGGAGTYSSDSTLYTPNFGNVSISDVRLYNRWLMHVGGGHYKFIGKISRTLQAVVPDTEITFFGYNDSDFVNARVRVSPGLSKPTSGWEYLEATSVAPQEPYLGGDFGIHSADELSEIYIQGEDAELEAIRSAYNDGKEIRLRVRERRPHIYNIETANRSAGEINDVYDVIHVSNFLSGSGQYVLGVRNPDSSEIRNKDGVSAQLGLLVPPGAELIVEVLDGTANKDKHPANFDLLSTNGYITDGLLSQGYRPDANPVEHILDYMLNPNYGMGLNINQIDKTSFIDSAIACQRVPEFGDHARTEFKFGGNDASTADQNEYMYGEGATTGSSANGSLIRTANNSYDRQFIINTNQSHLNNINTMLASFGGILSVINGKFVLRLENAGDLDDSENIPPQTALIIDAVINDKHIIDGATLSVPSVNDKYNQIKVDFTDVTNHSQPNSVMTPDPVDDSTGIRTSYLAEDNDKALEADFAIPSIVDPVTAKKYSTFLLKKSRNQARLELRCSSVALDCVPGSFVRVDSALMKINDVYRVTDVTYNNDHTVGLSLIRHIPDFYDVSDTGQVFESKRNIMDLS
jgi:hypothetical protein